MHRKEFWILTNKCGNNLKHENEAEEPWLFSLVFVLKIIFTFMGQKPKFFFSVSRDVITGKVYCEEHEYVKNMNPRLSRWLRQVYYW